MADLKTQPRNLGTAKFSSMKAETVLDLVAPELTRNRRLDRRVRAKPTEGNISIEQGSNPDASGLLPPGFEPFPDVGTSQSGSNRN